jgi:DNA-binding NarL/FixJ family response regulator
VIGGDVVGRMPPGVAAGDSLLSPSVTGRLIAEVAALPRSGRSSAAGLDELTNREREVMALVAGGLTNGEIAERLVVSRATAKTHVSRAMRKLHAHDRAQLVVLAYQTGMVTAGEPPHLADHRPRVSSR